MIRKRVLEFNWRVAVARILVNAAALGLTFLVLPGLKIVHPNLILTLIFSGLIFGLLNAFIRPILQFALFNFLFATFGLVLVIINFILLFLLGRLLPGWFTSTSWWVLLIAAALVGLFGVILENLLGLTPPIVEHAPEPYVAPTQNPTHNKLMAFLTDDDTEEVSAEQQAPTENGQGT